MSLLCRDTVNRTTVHPAIYTHLLNTNLTQMTNSILSDPHEYWIVQDSRGTEENGGANDDGEEQINLYKISFSSEVYLTAEQAVAKAEERGEWEILSFGEGEWSREGKYSIGYLNRESWEEWTVDNYELTSLN